MWKLLAWIQIFGAIQFCASFPVSAVTLGEQNAFMLGTITIFIFGFAIVGCVCCRRNKKGFEEFQNESGILENNKTEYPIFRALSPDNQRSDLPLNSGVIAVNNSNENLISNDHDNNNGPISSADLENIENNNAEHYIQNQNEINDSRSSSSLSENQNLVETVEETFNQNNNATTNNVSQQISISNSIVGIKSNALNFSDHNLIANIINTNETLSSTSFDIRHTTTGVRNFYETLAINNTVAIVNEKHHSNGDLPKIEANCKINSIDYTQHMQETPNKRSTVINIELALNDDTNLSQKKDHGDETSSLGSNYSNKSHEENSVEEALRILDDVIKSEELDEDEDEDENECYNTCNEFDESSTHFQYVIQQLLINNNIDDEEKVNYSNYWPNDNPEIIKTSLNPGLNCTKANGIYIETIRNVAESLIDSIIKESEQIVEIRKDTIESDQCFERTFDLMPLNIKYIPFNLNLSQDKSDDVYENNLQRSKSLENFFPQNIETSTPCVHNKFVFEENCHSNKFSKICLKNLFENPITTKPSDLINSSSDEFNILNVSGGKQIIVSPVDNKTFEINRTFDLDDEKNQMNFIHPGDPCTSKQALERDYNFGHCRRDLDDINSEDLTTLTPVNTPIELNYPYETWNKIMTQKTSLSNGTNPEPGDNLYFYPNMNDQNNETFEADDNETSLESTFEALKKQLAEILPQPQGISGPPEYSDDEEENENTRTFDEYRSPLDGIIGLLESETSSSSTVQNEVFINYKRSLSPIMEESEEETCKTFVMNETKCLDSTSSGCIETGEAIMGVTKTLMASNDTLFNFEDTLGEKEDVFSPRIPSRSDVQISSKSGISTAENSVATPTESSDTEKEAQHIKGTGSELNEEIAAGGRKTPPKTIDFISVLELKQDSELCSPDQQKTFSEGTSTSTTDRISSDVSPTVDHDITFTTNTIDEKTCITVIVKDDERISEISEPEWGSTASNGGCELNSLTDVPSIDFNVNNFEAEGGDNGKQEISDHVEKLSSEENASSFNDVEKNSCHDDSGHSTQTSITDDRSITNNISAQLMQSFQKSNNLEETFVNSYITNENENHNEKAKCMDFLKNEINYSSTQKMRHKINEMQPSYDEFVHLLGINHGNIDLAKENTDPNIKNDLNFLINESNKIPVVSHQKVQTDIQDTVIAVGKKKNNSSISAEYLEKDMITVYTTEVLESRIQNEQKDITSHLSGEEDPWIAPLKQRSDIDEWDSDVDDSHSSEEFMYIRGSPTKEDVLKLLDASNDTKAGYENECSTCNESNVWSANEDIKSSKPKKIKNLTEHEISEEESSSEFEGEFVPSCWNSTAIPIRSALKSPDKTNNKNKKNRNVAFKKQRYHSVYEYPKESTSLSSSYSESSLWNKNSENMLYFDTSQKEEFNDGFTVSSSMRPFHGCQFNALCHTWPTDSDFSWSQIIEELDNKPLVTYTDIDMKSDENDITQNKTATDNKRPDSGVGESAETLSDRIAIGELCHTKSTLHLPLELLPNTKSISNNVKCTTDHNNHKDSQLFTTGSIVLPTPSCTGSMDSLSSNSSSERQTINFPTFDKMLKKTVDKDRSTSNDIVGDSDQYEPSLRINGDSTETNLIKIEKIRQSDSTDEDSGIESIVKINK